MEIFDAEFVCTCGIACAEAIVPNEIKRTTVNNIRLILYMLFIISADLGLIGQDPQINFNLMVIYYIITIFPNVKALQTFLARLNNF